MAKSPDNPKRPGKTPKSKAHRPDVQPIGPALAELLNPAINRGDAGTGSGTRLLRARAHRARAPPRDRGEDVAMRDPGPAMPLRPNPQPPGARKSSELAGLDEAPQANYGTSATIPTLDPELARQLGLPTAEDDEEALARPPRNKMEALGVKATAEALENLIRDGRPEFRRDDGSLKVWTPHRPPRPEKSEGGVRFELKSPYTPRGD